MRESIILDECLDDEIVFLLNKPQITVDVWGDIFHDLLAAELLRSRGLEVPNRIIPYSVNEPSVIEIRCQTETVQIEVCSFRNSDALNWALPRKLIVTSKSLLGMQLDIRTSPIVEGWRNQNFALKIKSFSNGKEVVRLVHSRPKEKTGPKSRNSQM